MYFVDLIQYGNPPEYQRKKMMKEDELTIRLYRAGLYEQILKEPPPLNSSLETKTQLKQLVRKINSLSKKEKEFCKRAESDMYGLYVDLLNQHNINDFTKNDIENFFNNTDPFVYRVKYFYNRPRPYQLAPYLQKDLYLPIKTSMTDSPAYPSGHAYESTLLSLILSERFPQIKDELMTLAKNITASRMYIGVHYKSDNIFAVKLAMLTKNYVSDLL